MMTFPLRLCVSMRMRVCVVYASCEPHRWPHEVFSVPKKDALERVTGFRWLHLAYGLSGRVANAASFTH